MKTQYECVFISNWPHGANCYQCGRSREEHDKGTATVNVARPILLLEDAKPPRDFYRFGPGASQLDRDPDDVTRHSGDGGEGVSDFHRSLESRDEEANTPGDRQSERDAGLDRELALTVQLNTAIMQRDDLLAACKVLVDHAKEMYPHFESIRGQGDIAQAEAAINKAERTHETKIK